MSPFSSLAVTLLFHLNVLNNLLIAFAAVISALVSAAMFCFSFSSDVCMVPLVANTSSKRALEAPKSIASSFLRQLRYTVQCGQLWLIQDKGQHLRHLL